ncbi:RHS repeat-associated core domain-containing protein [Actinoallomurus liliacearum]|uniref:RHS repeat-associated core domain-containing protein n=1 Tax=Actinoallomurus liliacearum TaxID=1080073 RepID=A0ABP8TY09_9ACTN
MRGSGITGWIGRGWAEWMARSLWLRASVAMTMMISLLSGAYFFLGGPAAPHVPGIQGAQGVRKAHYAKPPKPHDDAAKSAGAGPSRLPSGGTGVVSFDLKHLGSTGRVTAHGTPVWARPVPPAGGGAYHGPSQVAVKVASRKAAAAAGVNGVLFTATEKGGTGPVTIGVDYHAFAGAYGGNYGSRLQLVTMPACALTTPQTPSCRVQTPLRAGGNDVRAHSAYTQIDPSSIHPAALNTATRPGTVQPASLTTHADAQNAASESMVLAATTGGSADGGNDGGSPAGTYSATTLSPSGSWSAGGSNGSFTYSYPIQVPPAASALIPSVKLAYDSGSVDGQTSATQAQASWLGDGWSTPQSYIEQSFKSCSDSPEGSAAPKSTADECYDGPVLTMSLNGSTTSLVWDSAKKTYTPADDNGEVIKHYTDSNNGSGTYNTDYWQVTDRTGTVFLFGRNQLPGWSSGKTTTNSVDSEPVFSAHSGDPCYKATWADSYCTMAYRWKLDYVKDLHGNAMAYYYKQDTNAYARNADTSGTTTPKANATFVRDSHLDHIDYGFTDGNAYTVNGGHAPDQVQFTTGDRCLSGTCDPLNKTNAANWPDVPYDLNCTDGSDCLVTAPSFWSTVRLTGIKTQQWNGTTYVPVDSWEFTQTLPATGDGTSPTLWLSKIAHTGSDTTAGGSAVTLPTVTFTAKEMDNRLDRVTDGLPALTRMRINSITTETGAVTGVNYTLTNPCSATAKPTPATNTSSCYPVYWTPKDNTKPLLDWFNKYQVNSVTQADTTGGAPTTSTSYKYLDGGAWHYDDNEVVKAKYRTYGQWRGFGRVQTFTGQGADAQTETEDTYYRGMSKDNNTTAVTLTDSQGGKHEDLDELAGDTLESTTYNYADGPATGSTINSYWVSPPTATRARTGLPDLTATASGQVETWSRKALTDGTTTTWRKSETDTSYDTDTSSATFGLPLVVYTHGDLSRSDQRQCAVTTYAPANTDLNLAGLPAEVETDAVACGGSNPGGTTAPGSGQVNALTAPTSVTRPDDVVSDQRTFYDQASLTTWPQAHPTKGEASAVQIADGYSSGAFTYRTTSTTAYDSYGRVTDTYDALGNKTHTDYTNPNGVTIGSKVTNPLGQATSTTYDPLRNLPVSTTDANGITTTAHYDGLGRITAVWEYGRATSSPANLLYTYDINTSAPSVVTTKEMNDAQGYITSTALYDALLRPRQTQNPTPQGGRLVTDTFYDTRGWTWKKNNAWWDPGSTPGSDLVTVPDAQVHDQQDTEFDGAGRAILATSYDDSHIKEQTATVYDQTAANGGGATITVPLNASGQPYNGAPATATVTDALGRTIQTAEYTTAPAVTVNPGQGTAPITTVTITGGSTTASSGNPQATQYIFNSVGRQTDVKNLATGDDWHTDYNLLGQAITKQDPDAGTSTIAYDVAGNITQTTDARGKTISFTYDPLGRKTGEYAAALPDQASSNQLASWVYDNSDNKISGMANPIGHLTTSTSYIGGSGSSGHAYTEQASGFNVWGESTGETIKIPDNETGLNNSYTFTHTYTSGIGLPWRDIYPATGTLPSETVTHGYSTALDVPSGLVGLSSYEVDTTWDAYGRATQNKIGSTKTNAYIFNTYDLHTGALTDTKLANTAASSTPIDETSYTYDPAGNPLTQTETRQGTTTETQCFGYDTLDRLAQAWTATDSCATDPSSNNGSTVGSGITKGAYWTSWTFNPLGQRTNQTEHGFAGIGDTVTTYKYDGNDADQPHTLTKTTTVGPTGSTATSTMSYDKSGDTATRTTPDQGQQTLTWDDEGKLTTVTGSSGGSSYIYDADGNLLLQKDPGTTTLYLPGEQLALNTSTGAITGTRFYALPGGGEAIRTGSGTNYTFATGDQHGTATLTIDPAFTVPTWRQQTPYGAPRGTAPAFWPDNHGFLNKPQDTATGLTDVGARWYDPITGTFASLDPIFEATDSQQQGGYNYAASNPITSSDPSGLYTCRNGNEGCDAHGNPPCSDADVGCNGDTRKGDCVHTECGDGTDQNLDDPYRGPDGKAHRTVQNRGNDATAAARAAARAREENRRQKLRSAILQKLQEELRALPDYEENGQAYVQLDCSFGENSGCVGGYPDRLLTLIQGYFGLDALNSCVHGKYAQCLPALIAAASSLERGGVKACDSFAGETQVPLADGKSKPIDQIKVGDKIADALPGADPGTHDQTHTVTAVHVTRTDRDYTDVTIATATGPRTITGTSHHLYWDATTRAWTPADHLHAGDRVQTTQGHTATIVALHRHTDTMVTYNLTVDGLHTYYVEAGATPVLVHNSGLCGIPMSSAIGDDPLLVKAAQQAGRNQTVQREMDNLFSQLSNGNANPGIGTKSLAGTDVSYARGANGARLFFRNVGGGIQIVGKADKSNESRVIGRLKQIYGQ